MNIARIVPMNTILNIKKVSLAFFCITGLIHLSTSLLIANELLLRQAFTINKIMDIPFIITGLIYALASLRLNFTNPDSPHKILDISLISIIMLVLAGLIYINLALPDLAI